MTVIKTGSESFLYFICVSNQINIRESLLFVFNIYEKSAFALIDLDGDSLGASTP